MEAFMGSQQEFKFNLNSVIESLYEVDINTEGSNVKQWTNAMAEYDKMLKEERKRRNLHRQNDAMSQKATMRNNLKITRRNLQTSINPYERKQRSDSEMTQLRKHTG